VHAFISAGAAAARQSRNEQIAIGTCSARAVALATTSSRRSDDARFRRVLLTPLGPYRIVRRDARRLAVTIRRSSSRPKKKPKSSR
jgi:hypothetical protein